MARQPPALSALDKIIKKSRVHLYKPIQIAEILYRDRLIQDINLNDLNTYRTQSKRWRDEVCLLLVGRTSTSSARFQDNLFEPNAMPVRMLAELGKINRSRGGAIEEYIYGKFNEKLSQMRSGLDYCIGSKQGTFELKKFLDFFWLEPGLKRSIDKIYEIVVYSLFSALMDALSVKIRLSLDKKKRGLLREFEDFAEKIMMLNLGKVSLERPARIFRVGVTNAADRGLDMWGNFGLAIQIKHLSLTVEMAENIVSSVSADRIVIVCKDAEKDMIVSLLNQIGWKSKIQSIITEDNLFRWYEKGLRGKFASQIGEKVLKNLAEQIESEFPSMNNHNIRSFYKKRGYNL